MLQQGFKPPAKSGSAPCPNLPDNPHVAAAPPPRVPLPAPAGDADVIPGLLDASPDLPAAGVSAMAESEAAGSSVGSADGKQPSHEFAAAGGHGWSPQAAAPVLLMRADSAFVASMHSLNTQFARLQTAALKEVMDLVDCRAVEAASAPARAPRQHQRGRGRARGRRW